MSGPPKLVLLGMMTKMPVAGVIWQTVHYLVGFRRLGFDAYYVEAHARTPSMLMRSETDDSSALAAAFLDRVLRRFDLGDRWAFHALHDDGSVHGMSPERLRRLYAEAELVINLHGGTDPRPEHYEHGRLVYLETDPVQLQVELHDDLESTIAFLEPHVAFFSFAENLGRTGCALPVPQQFDFRTTRQPVVTELWLGADGEPPTFTTVGNWRQTWRSVTFGGERYTWSKDHEFLKFLDVPARTGQDFELALASYEAEDRRLLEGHGWRVRDALEISIETDDYRDYIRRSRGEFTVAKDQNVRLQTGWFSDRSASYLASGRPVITQDTGFGSVLPVGEGLFSFSDVDRIAEAVAAIDGDYARHRRGAFAVAREFFDAAVVLVRLLDDVGVPVARRHAGQGVPTLPPDLVLVPCSRRPLRLPAGTTEAALALPLPPRRAPSAEAPGTSVVAVTLDNLAVTRLCLETVLATTGDDVELIVVDNGSCDGTEELLRALAERDGRVRPVLNGANRGFAGAVNQGLAAARGAVFVVLNNDTVVPPGWLERLQRPLADGAVGLVGPTTNDAGNEAEIEVPYRTYGELLDFARKRAVEMAGRLADLSVATMFCTAMRREVLDAVGPLDERFEIGLFEDDDYSMRVRSAGYRVVLAEDAFVHHFGEATFGALVPTGEHARVFRANQRRLEEKWAMRWRSHERRPRRHYRAVVDRLRRVVDASLPADATVLVVSNGDDELLALGGRMAWHFPAMEDGTYAGHHPADGAEAITRLEALQDKGARYLVFPETAAWWLEHYTDLAAYLGTAPRRAVCRDEACVIFDLAAEGMTGEHLLVGGGERVA
jgi:GT2 family glycosyltransferase